MIKRKTRRRREGRRKVTRRARRRKRKTRKTRRFMLEEWDGMNQELVSQGSPGQKGEGYGGLQRRMMRRCRIVPGTMYPAANCLRPFQFMSSGGRARL